MFLVSLLLAPAHAADPWSIAVHASAGKDLPAAESLPAGALGAGGGVRMPVRWSPRPGAALRVELAVDLAPGSDRVEWSPEGQGAVVYSDRHWTFVAGAWGLAGPEWTLVPRAPQSPYLAAGGGLAGVAHFHVFEGTSAELGEGLAGEIAPYTFQVVPAAGAALGMRFGRSEALAFEVEVGYSAAFLPAARLQRAPASLEASRSAYALDVVRLGVGVTLPLRGRP